MLAFSAIMISGPILQESDLVASVVIGSICFISVLSFLSILLERFSVLRNLQLKTNSEHQALFSKALNTILIQSNRIKIWPLIDLSIDPAWEHQRPNYLPLICRNRTPEFLMFNINFPHRGNWKITNLNLHFRDQLGLFELKHSFQHEQVFTVYPQIYETEALPAISSFQRDGDEIISSERAGGDYYELKTYHPSDGLRRIAWKIFARTGELLARCPEQTFCPEGKIAIFCIAGSEDHLIRLLTNYLMQLQSYDINIHAGISGSDKIARSPEEFEELAVNEVWKSINNPMLDSFMEFITSCGEVNNINQIVLAISPSKLTQQYLAELLQIFAFLDHANLKFNIIFPELPEIEVQGILSKALTKTRQEFQERFEVSNILKNKNYQIIKYQDAQH